jgi:hypothetical protein
MSSDFNYRLQLQIEPHLHRIEKILGKDYRLTLIARCTRTDLADADILLTVDQWPQARDAAERLAMRAPSVLPPSPSVGTPSRESAGQISPDTAVASPTAQQTEGE